MKEYIAIRDITPGEKWNTAGRAVKQGTILIGDGTGTVNGIVLSITTTHPYLFSTFPHDAFIPYNPLTCHIRNCPLPATQILIGGCLEQHVFENLYCNRHGDLRGSRIMQCQQCPRTVDMINRIDYQPKQHYLRYR